MTKATGLAIAGAVSILVGAPIYFSEPKDTSLVDSLISETKPLIRDNQHPPDDDPSTTNDERNDQPLGRFGNETVEACTPHNGQCYTLDADITDGVPSQLYFPKGGNIELTSCLDYGGGSFSCDDENGREWEISARYY